MTRPRPSPGHAARAPWWRLGGRRQPAWHRAMARVLVFRSVQTAATERHRYGIVSTFANVSRGTASLPPKRSAGGFPPGWIDGMTPSVDGASRRPRDPPSYPEPRPVPQEEQAPRWVQVRARMAISRGRGALRHHKKNWTKHTDARRRPASSQRTGGAESNESFPQARPSASVLGTLKREERPSAESFP